MKKNSFIYLAQQSYSSLFKIGSSDNPEERLKQLQTANGERLELIETFETKNKFKLESALHRRFLSKKTLGEWFELTEEDLGEFKKACSTYENNFNYLRENNTYIQDKQQW